METKTKDEKIKENVKGGCGFILLIAVIMIVYSAFFGETKQLTPEEQRKEKIEKQFNAWDGSHINLTILIKESMNDPESYEHVNTTYIDHQKDLTIAQEYAGKNAFGGRVRKYVKAKVDEDGNVLTILEER